MVDAGFAVSPSLVGSIGDGEISGDAGEGDTSGETRGGEAVGVLSTLPPPMVRTALSPFAKLNRTLHPFGQTLSKSTPLLSVVKLKVWQPPSVVSPTLYTLPHSSDESPPPNETPLIDTLLRSEQSIPSLQPRAQTRPWNDVDFPSPVFVLVIEYGMSSSDVPVHAAFAIPAPADRVAKSPKKSRFDIETISWNSSFV